MPQRTTSDDAVLTRIGQVIVLLGELPASPAAGHRLDELAACFDDLRATDAVTPAASVGSSNRNCAERPGIVEFRRPSR